MQILQVSTLCRPQILLSQSQTTNVLPTVSSEINPECTNKEFKKYIQIKEQRKKKLRHSPSPKQLAHEFRLV